MTAEKLGIVPKLKYIGGSVVIDSVVDEVSEVTGLMVLV